MKTLVLAEKPSVARDLAAVLGATARREASLEGQGYVVTWAIGHLVGLAEPQEMDPNWRAWRMDRLAPGRGAPLDQVAYAGCSWPRSLWWPRGAR